MTILSETTKTTADTTGIMLMIAAILFLILFIAILNDVNSIVALIFLIVFIVCFIASWTICSKSNRQIKAIISDDYPATKLYDEYTVEDRDGKIWILTEKEPMIEKDDEE